MDPSNGKRQYVNEHNVLIGIKEKSFLMNKDELVSQMNLFENEFAKLKEAIIKEDVNTMKDMMKLSTERRKYFDK